MSMKYILRVIIMIDGIDGISITGFKLADLDLGQLVAFFVQYPGPLIWDDARPCGWVEQQAYLYTSRRACCYMICTGNPTIHSLQCVLHNSAATSCNSCGYQYIQSNTL